MRYLVTGGAGFIGSSIVRQLLAQGEDVVVLDDFSTGKPGNLAGLTGSLKVIQGSLLDEDALAEALSGVTFVLHEAAIASVPRSFADPLETLRVNSEGTLRLFLAARAQEVRRVVVASSAAGYGDEPTLPKTEELTPAPISPYALSKLDAEHLGAIFTRDLGLEVVCLRYFNVYGPRQDPHSGYAAAVPSFVTRLLAGEPPTGYGDGGQTRDFCYVADVARANLLACTAPGAAGQVCNVAGGQAVDLLTLIAAIDQAVGTGLAPRFAPARVGDIRHSWAATTRAASLLGWRPETDLVAGLARTVAWYREQPSPEHTPPAVGER